MSCAWVILKGIVSCSDRAPGAPPLVAGCPFEATSIGFLCRVLTQQLQLRWGLWVAAPMSLLHVAFVTCEITCSEATNAQQINGWYIYYIYLHLVDCFGKCRYINIPFINSVEKGRVTHLTISCCFCLGLKGL